MAGLRIWAAGLAIALGGVTVARAETLTIATVNNDDMIIMQKLSSKWEQQTGNKINWVILDENVPAPESDPRYHHEKRILRHHNDRRVRNAALGNRGWLNGLEA